MGKEKLESIAFDGRIITVVDGIPFYQSTGSSSGHKGCWFPFFGVSEDYGNKGWLRKPLSEFDYHYPEKNAGLYIIKSDIDLDKLTWDDLQVSDGLKSILLLQRNNKGELKARYLSAQYQEAPSFTYGDDPNGDFTIADELFLADSFFLRMDLIVAETESNQLEGDKLYQKTISFQDLKETEQLLFGSKYPEMEKKDIETKFNKLPSYQQIEFIREIRFPKKRLDEAFEKISLMSQKYSLSTIDSRLFLFDSQIQERVINLPLLCISQQLTLEQSEERLSQDGLDDASDPSSQFQQKAAQLLESQPRERELLVSKPSQSYDLTLDDESALDKAISEINTWIISHGGIIALEKDPLSYFLIIQSYDSFIFNQLLSAPTSSSVISFLEYIGESSQAQRSLERNDIFILRSLEKLAHEISAVVNNPAEDTESQLNNLLDNQPFKALAQEEKRRNLFDFLQQNQETKTEAVFEKITPVLKTLVGFDQVSVVSQQSNSLATSSFKNRLQEMQGDSSTNAQSSSPRT